MLFFQKKERELVWYYLREQIKHEVGLSLSYLGIQII